MKNLETERLINNAKNKNLYFWTIFEKKTNRFIGCVNLCNYEKNKKWQKLNL